MPRAINEDVDIFGQDIDHLCFFLIFNLPLTKVTCQIEKPALDLGLDKSEIVVNMHVIVAPTQNGDNSESCKEDEQADSVCVAVIFWILQEVNHQLEHKDRGKRCNFDYTELHSVLDGAKSRHSFDLIRDCISLTVLSLLLPQLTLDSCLLSL